MKNGKTQTLVETTSNRTLPAHQELLNYAQNQPENNEQRISSAHVDEMWVRVES